jgi:hypothetical protein
MSFSGVLPADTSNRQETATFVLLMDRCFDCLNRRPLEEADRKRKPALRPYTSTEDKMFTFLQDEFLKLTGSAASHAQPVFQ